jgi:hypothetical protein
VSDGLPWVKSTPPCGSAERAGPPGHAIELRPAPSGEFDYLGKQWWMFAFQQIGLDAETDTFGYSGAGGEGAGIEYFVDGCRSCPHKPPS